MAKKYYEGDLNLNLDWGGTEEQLPLSGGSVQKLIKDTLNSKIGYLGEVKEMADGTKLPTAFYVLCRDEASFNNYKQSVTADNPFGDLTSDGIMGRFDAPSNYTMKIDVFEPEGGYKSALASSTGNVIKFKAETQDKSGAPQQEGVTVTYRIKNSSGVETSQSVIYSYNQVSAGITYNLDGKISVGENTITITVVGENTGISSMRRITYNLLDMYFNDRFDIAKRYAFDSTGVLSIPVGYDIKGVGKTTVYFYFDGNLKEEFTLPNENPLISNANKNFIFTAHDEWMGIGLHSLQMFMKCVDGETKEEFFTPIYYREFVVESSIYELEMPYITRKVSFDKSKGVLAKNENPTIYDVKQFENVSISYAVYHRAKSGCDVAIYVEYPGKDEEMVFNGTLSLIKDNFSAIQKQEIILAENGPTKVYIRASYGEDSYVESTTNVEVEESDMKITTSDEGVVLYLNAFGRTNNSDDKAELETWEYRYLNILGQEEIITTTFSKNGYVLVSTKDIDGNVVKPNGVFEDNCLEVTEYPTKLTEENENYDFLIYNNEYYSWNREFDWSNTSGWSDGKLKLANGNAITINYKPFDEDKLEKLKLQGGTFEFEFETTNVYDDNAVICRICGNNNFAPGISIYASGAELAISRDIITDENNENAGYAKLVSTKYKSEESNRISFVITPDGDVNGDGTEYRNRILKIYVNGELCGAYAYDKGANFYNDSEITFRGGKDAGINIASIKIYERALSSTEILNNYIYYRTNSDEKTKLYENNDIVSSTDSEQFDADKLKSSIPVMTFYQIFENETIEALHQEKKDKKLARHFDILYIDTQNPNRNFFIKCAYVTPQGTSSMNYPVKNFRIYTTKDDRTKLYVGSEIFLDGNSMNHDESNLNPKAFVAKGKYAFKDGSIPVKCWCLKADFAESSSSHNTGTARYWNEVLVNAGYTTKAQRKAQENDFKGDVRTTIDGFPIVLFYERIGGKLPEFQGKYNFNNDKSSEDVFGFTGGDEIETQEVKYFYIGNERPIIQYDKKNEEYACSFEEGGYTETPTVDSPLYVSDKDGKWYMLRGKELFDNPKMECWELLNSVNDLALFKTAKTFSIGDGDEKVGLELESGFDGAFESRYPDCGDYYHTNSLRRFAEWLISCRYLTIDDETGGAIPFTQASLPVENYHLDSDGKLIIQSLTKKDKTFKLDYPNYNFYTEVPYNTISAKITVDGYATTTIDNEDVESVTAIAKYVDKIPTVKDEEYEYLIDSEGRFYTWQLGNTLYTDEVPVTHEESYDYVCIGTNENKENGIYYIWKNEFDFSLYHEPQHVEDNAFNRALKFAVEKYDHIEMDKMAAYYIYLMRFGGVDQTVKNSMLTTEGPAVDDPNSTLPSLWYFINYDNDTILGVKNDGRLVFDPYITRETKDGTGYVYAGRESTLWNNLEADIEFMEHVTAVDNNLASSTGNSLYTLSYANALREYDTNQSDKWCQRIYNKDAETKYINTYVNGWTQHNSETNETLNNVYEDYLYDVQGSRSAHRKWWLGRRFNVFDSRFANANFRASLIKFRSTNLPAGSSFAIKSGEPVYYAWGHDNAITEMTEKALLAGESETFTTTSAFNIGSYLELMGAANIATFNLRDCVGALTEIDVTGCYSPSVGTKMKEILVGNHTRTDLINNGTTMKFSGLEAASKLEVLDVTNIKNLDKLDGLNKLLNIRNLYAKGTSVSNFTFADGCHIKYLELPSTTETLSLTRSSMIRYANIVSEDSTYANLYNLTIDNCKNLMTDYNFVMSWLAVKKKRGDINRVNINLQGIDWKFDEKNIDKLFYFEGIGKNAMSSLNIRGTITTSVFLTIEYIDRLKNIFGNECFTEGAAVYIKAPTGLYFSEKPMIYEGSGDVTIDITAVGVTLDGNLDVTATVTEETKNGNVIKVIEATDGIVTMDKSNIKRGSISVNIKESNNNYIYLNLEATYRDAKNQLREPLNILIYKRSYPSEVEATSLLDSYSDTEPNSLKPLYTPNDINDLNLEGRGFFSAEWSIVWGTTGYENSVVLSNKNEETAYITTPNGFDGNVRVRVTITRIHDKKVLCYGEKEIEFKNPNTIITVKNGEIYNILVDAGIIKLDETGYGKLTISEASNVTVYQLLKPDGTSIFAGNKQLTSFTEFQYFNNLSIGQMPQESMPDLILIPDGFFAGCSNLTEIAFSRNFAYTANKMFSGCTKLEHVYGPKTGYDDNKNVVYGPLSFRYVGDEMCSGCKKLKTFNLSNTTIYIGYKAFNECESLEEFTIPSTSTLKIAYAQDSNPFMKCPNITFNGSTYDISSPAKYQIKDEAVYEVTEEKISLLHLGKNSLVSNIISDKPVYACAYAMEYRTEPNPVIPSNIILNGSGIFWRSKGESIKLNCLVTETSNNLFEESNYGNNYNFADNETIIPFNAFRNVTSINEYVIQEGIINIKGEAFHGASKLKRLTFPSTLEYISNGSMWLCSSLKTMIFNGLIPPRISADDLFNVMLDEIIVKPEAYETFVNEFSSESTKDEFIKLLTPFIKTSHLFSEGYVRVIKDGEYLLPNEDNVIKVGGLSVTQEDEFMKYATDEIITDLTVTLNGEVIGTVEGIYTTLYIGDNSALFNGDGYNFTKGIYDETIVNTINDNGWYYDKRFEGIRSGESVPTNMVFDISTINKECGLDIIIGQYSQSNFRHAIVTDSENIELFNLKNNNGFKKQKNLLINTDNININFYVDKYNFIRTGIDGLVVNSIGNKIYSDPIYMADSVRLVNVICSCDKDIPVGTLIELWDDKGREYRTFYSGEAIEFHLPVGEFNFIAHGFVTPEGKTFNDVEGVILSDVEGDFEIVYETITGIETIMNKDTLKCLKLSDRDYYINLTYGESIWGNNFNNEHIDAEDVVSSTADGYDNTNIVLSVDADNEMFNKAKAFNFGDSTIEGYIPSYEELLIVSENMNETLETSWTSETCGENKAWASDGNAYERNTVMKYYIFGKKMKY